MANETGESTTRASVLAPDGFVMLVALCDLSRWLRFSR